MKKTQTKTVKTSITGWIPKKQSLKETLRIGLIDMKEELPPLDFCVDRYKEIAAEECGEEKIQKVRLTATLIITRERL